MQQMKRLHRVLLAAGSSGSGKTMLTCGLLNLLKRRGYDIGSFKCGPDYIDPMFHRSVLGMHSGNLDSWFCPGDTIPQILAGCGHDYAVLEGVMGIYDGLGGISARGSCYEVACISRTPVILILDAYGAGRTIFSVLKGILAEDTHKLICGVIFNRISPEFYARLKAAAEEELAAAGYSVPVLGGIPKLPELNISSRHLGLMLPEEITDLHRQLDRLSDVMEECCDVEGILAVMQSAPELTDCREETSAPKEKAGLRLAVARDQAFCFYYAENLRLLQEQGVELVPFSPIRDAQLPPQVHGLLLGGGYPELWLKELQANSSMRASICSAIQAGLPSLAECGGFLYLHQELCDEEGTPYRMLGLLPGRCQKQKRLGRFGYVQLALPQAGSEHFPLQAALQGMKGHEFHYYGSPDPGCDIIAEKPVGGSSWNVMHTGKNHVWGFPHLYYPSCPGFVNAFVEEMKDYARKQAELLPLF